MARIRFLSDQIYETGGPGKGPKFPEGFVLDAAHVADVLGVDSPSESFVPSWLRRWVSRNVAEYVGDDVEVSDLGDIVLVGVTPINLHRPFGTQKYGRLAAGIENGGDAGDPTPGKPNYGALTRDELDKLAADRGVDVAAAKNKGEVIAALEAADAAAKPE